MKRERRERKERIITSEQGPDVELTFPVSVFSMLNTSWLTHRYPTALALRAVLPLSPLSRSAFDASWAGERDGTWGGGCWSGEVCGADVKCESELTCCVQNISPVQPRGLTCRWWACETRIRASLCRWGVKLRLISQKLFGLLRWFWLLAYINLRGMQHEYWRAGAAQRSPHADFLLELGCGWIYLKSWSLLNSNQLLLSACSVSTGHCTWFPTNRVRSV